MKDLNELLQSLFGDTPTAEQEKVKLHATTVAGWILSCRKAEQIPVCQAATKSLITDFFKDRNIGKFKLLPIEAELDEMLYNQALLIASSQIPYEELDRTYQDHYYAVGIDPYTHEGTSVRNVFKILKQDGRVEYGRLKWTDDKKHVVFEGLEQNDIVNVTTSHP